MTVILTIALPSSDYSTARSRLIPPRSVQRVRPGPFIAILVPMDERKRTHERYDIANADILFEDTWADEDATACPECGHDVSAAISHCPRCGARVDVCSGSCSSCGARTCVGSPAEDGSERRKR